ncbi:hypothetical protein [Chitinimonas sp. JJ19]|uniref:hypothetical protein n=1 Tax=Chitinimonas sp. JJ19 TaxID=3109352 RepID=UPI001A4E07BC|nr:hypothetical protein [Chitinimonas sp.]
MPCTLRRSLTAGERQLLGSVFGRALDYDRIRICSLGAMPGAAATVLGCHISYAAAWYRPDFALAELALQALLVHEATHVWQYQQRRQTGYTTPLKAAWEHLRYGRQGVYDYRLAPGKALCDYRYEQQGRLLQDYYLLKHGAAPAAAPDSLADYEAVIYRSIRRDA